MGKLTANAEDRARDVVEGVLDAVENGTTFVPVGQAGSRSGGRFNVTLTPGGTFAGTVSIERSFDGGTTWTIMRHPLTHAALTFVSAADGAGAASMQFTETERDVLYRAACSARSAGSCAYRFSQ